MSQAELTRIFNWYRFTRGLLQGISKALVRSPEQLLEIPWPKELEWQPVDKAQVILRRALEELDDLAVLALFAKFEVWLIRDITQVLDSKGELLAPFEKKVLACARKAVKRQRLASLLDVYKIIVPAEIVRQVKQIREYRNWVAHGKRGLRPVAITPKEAYERLNEFMAYRQKAKEVL